ncbi:MAG: hypothetical protein AAF806_26820 [Bacteroidota bacterium]
MTAVAGILNKQAVAIAADSAVTISGENGRKIFNTANKIFTLSKRHPVGVAIYNSASFMSIPWETIIKMYRRRLKDDFFDTVEEYQKDFIDYLREQNFFTSEDYQKIELKNLFMQLFSAINDSIFRSQNSSIPQADLSNPEDVKSLVQEKIDDLLNNIQNASIPVCDEFENYDFEDFKEYSGQVFSEAYEKMYLQYEVILDDDYVGKLLKFCYEYCRLQNFSIAYTGLVFTGFGEKEIYPSLIPIQIANVFDNRLRYYIEKDSIAKITNENASCIMPFAQKDVIDTILSGVDPTLDSIYIEQFRRFTEKYTEELANRISHLDSKFAEQLKNADLKDVVQEYQKEMQNIKRVKYIYPLMNAVASLSKEDLAEMAESLIYLTYLKRRITFAEESVGGPVDVALISKGDGFIWIKRKHYFDAELNKPFFDNYFKNS